MVKLKLNRAMAEIRHLSPITYMLVNELWKQEIGRDNLFKLRFTLTYVISYLEDYLTQCERKFQQLQG